jgi:hypothetical protein
MSNADAAVEQSVSVETNKAAATTPTRPAPDLVEIQRSTSVFMVPSSGLPQTALHHRRLYNRPL